MMLRMMPRANRMVKALAAVRSLRQPTGELDWSSSLAGAGSWRSIAPVAGSGVTLTALPRSRRPDELGPRPRIAARAQERSQALFSPPTGERDPVLAKVQA
jgi:hypothetical protein